MLDSNGDSGPPCEPILELREVSRHVFGAHRPVGSHHRGLDVSEDGVHPFEGGLAGGLRAAAGWDRGVRAADFGDGCEAGEAVGDNRGTGVERRRR